ncbi:MAG: cell division ATP-binding protein FtsE [Firmicutes bacterium]|nr:cell division ATP-binding protein FtsE [Bacillota bacterium]MBQ9890626.1 cell division ATP-binding protein FtsE [Bacillota bacterium]
MIDFKHVTKEYGDTVALEDATIHIDQGDFVFLVGPTGAGKSTFIKLISKELEPDSGEIIVAGKELSKMSNREIPIHRRDIGMVFQDFKLLDNKTVFENVAFAMEIVHCSRRTINRQVPQMLSVMGIEDKANNFPQELSAGEQQRVAIARAIINNPRILIADEPTGNLDPDTAWEIMELINTINRRGTTVVMVTHAKDIVNRMGKRVVAIDRGRIVRDNRGGEYGYDD